MTFDTSTATDGDLDQAEAKLKAAFTEYFGTLFGSAPLDIMEFSYQARVLTGDAEIGRYTGAASSMDSGDILGMLDYHEALIKARLTGDFLGIRGQA